MTQVAPALTPAATLYSGTVMHARLQPFGHRFEYKVFSLLLDIDRLEEANKASKFFSVNKRNVASFYEADHIDNRVSEPANGIRAYVDALYESAQIKRPDRVELLAYPRMFGHAFNPISLYYGYDKSGALTAMIYEVRNTFGERHTYVCAVEQGELTDAGLRQSRMKLFHVSPFIGMKARYDFRLIPPAEYLNFRIMEHDENGPLLSATFHGTAQPLTNKSLGLALLRIPFLGFKIVAGIHFEALRLWLKGAKFHRSPKPPEAFSIADTPSNLAGE